MCCSYNSLWYKTPPKSQKMLLLVMQKSFQPISLSACKIYIFSMENFTTVNLAKILRDHNAYVIVRLIILIFNLKIMQTSMSYFTVLASME